MNFSPAMSNAAGNRIREEMRSWRLHLRSDKSLETLGRMFRPTLVGWINYYAGSTNRRCTPLSSTSIGFCRGG